MTPSLQALRTRLRNNRPALLRAMLASSLIKLAVVAAVYAAAAFSGPAAQAQVGLLQIGNSEQPLTVVYPTAAPAATQTLGPFQINAALGAAPVRGNGRLVVLSHGTGGNPLTEFDLARRLALAGFVVAQPLHAGDNFRDQRLAGPEAWKLRPVEASRAIDAVGQDARFAGLLRLDKVGVYGMSAGGSTGLALAGGQWSVATLVKHCAAHGQDDAGFCFFGMTDPAAIAQRTAGYAAGNGNMPVEPQGGAKVHDPRVAAVALSVPVSAIFSAESLAAIKVPVGLLEAGSDQVLAPAYHSGYVLAQCKTCERLDRIEGAGHFDVLSPWPQVLTQQMAHIRGSARNPNLGPDRLAQAQDRIVGFFRRTLLDAPVATAAMNMGITELPGLAGDGPVTVFYPTQATEAPVRRAIFTRSLAENGAPARGNGRLVVISHGTGSAPWGHTDIARALVQAGYVVAFPEHRGDNFKNDSDTGPESYKRRPAEVSRAIDAVAQDARFSRLLTLDKVGLFGFSAGGHTALSLAGGRWSPSRFLAHCEAHLSEDFPACVGLALRLTGGMLDGMKKTVALGVLRQRFADTTWYTHDDPRVKVIVAAAPAAMDFDASSLAAPRVPLGLVVLEQDKWLSPRFHSGAILQACKTCTVVADLPTAGHGAMLSPQPPLDRLPDALVELLRDPPDFDRATALPEVNRKIITFLSQQLLP